MSAIWSPVLLEERTQTVGALEYTDDDYDVLREGGNSRDARTIETLDRICSSTMDVVMHVARSNLMPEIASVVGINLMLALAKAFAPLSPRESAFTPPGNPALAHPLLTEQVGGASLRMDSACHKHTRESVCARLPTSLCDSLCLSLCLCLSVSLCLSTLFHSLSPLSHYFSPTALSLCPSLSHTHTFALSRPGL